MFLLPGNGPRSSSTTDRPARASCQRRRRPGRSGADHDDVDVRRRLSRRQPPTSGPVARLSHGSPPGGRRAEAGEQRATRVASVTTARSASGIIGQCASVLTLITCAARRGRSACWTAPLIAERDVQLRVDDHAGGADLALVAHPAPVGDHPGRPDARPERGAERGELVEPRRAVQPRTAGDDPRCLGEVDRGRVGGEGRGDLRIERGARLEGAISRTTGSPATARDTPRRPGCSVATKACGVATWCSSVPRRGSARHPSR